jgi:phosphoenolpyruvate-protein kinase (PTS system EI component)
VPPHQRRAEVDRAGQALDGAAAELEAVAARLREEGRADEADVVEIGAIMAGDPTLRMAVAGMITQRGIPATQAILQAAESQADLLAALDDADLAARASDVRSLGRRAARLASGQDNPSPGRAAATILIAADLGPADVAELGSEVRGIGLAEGGATAHAAIVARSLGLPMAVRLGADLLEVPEGAALIVDGTAGTLAVEPGVARRAAAEAALHRHARLYERAADEPHLPSTTHDGRTIRVLANVAGRGEVELALAAGAEGVGLLRTELAFLDAPDWPTVEQHRWALEPILTPLTGRVATVRLLDYGGDKLPSFLRGDAATARGIRLLLGASGALAAQLRAILAAGAGTELRILIPMVLGPEDVCSVRAVFTRVVAEQAARRVPPVGAMVETPAAVDAAAELAGEVDFVSLGTNDLAHLQLGVGRGGGPAPAHHPAVLRLIDRTVRAARAAGIPVAVCGEAASDPLALPLLVGLGVDELSVGAARVGVVRAWVRALDHASAHGFAARALVADDAREVERLVRPLRDLLAAGEAGAQGLDGGNGVVAFGPNP